MPSFVEALDAEIAQLRSELDGDPRFIKLRELENVRKLYPASQVFGRPVDRQTFSQNPSTGGRKASEQTQKIMDLCADSLRAAFGQPVPTVKLLDLLVANDIAVPGKDPRNSLSAILSHSPRFRSRGRAGWVLAVAKVPEEPGKDTETADEPSQDESAASAEPRPTSGNLFVRPANPWPGGGT
jgi:hypothetical protein